MNKKETYNIFTIISMIVGIVIGSGIYFKADDILYYTEGNIKLGILVLGLGSICIVFGALSLSVLARNITESGGVSAYFEHFINKDIATGLGWFHTFVYMPTAASVVGWAAGIYTFLLFGIEASLGMQVALGIFYNLFFVFINSRSRKLGGYVQTISTAIKLIPLFLIAIYGIFFAEPIPIDNASKSFSDIFREFSWISALVPLMFAYDGWTISLAISTEVKNPKKNVTRALIISPFIILIAYLSYLLGISNILGANTIIELGDSAIFEAIKLILGQRLANVFLVVIIISMLGVVNGVNLSLIRMPQALAEKNMIPDNGISKIDSKRGLSKKSVYISYIVLTLWSIINYFVIKYSIFNGRDVSEISIVFNYLSYILLYKVSFDFIKKDGKKAYLLIPILATIGSLIIFIGSLIASFYNVLIFSIICLLVVFFGYKYSKKKNI